LERRRREINKVRAESCPGIGMTSGSRHDASFFSDLEELLKELLKERPEALRLAEKLLKAYRERGVRGVREELKLLIEEATGNEAKGQENRG